MVVWDGLRIKDAHGCLDELVGGQLLHGGTLDIQRDAVGAELERPVVGGHSITSLTYQHELLAHGERF